MGGACVDVLFNVLETKLADVQTCRVVAYHLLSLEAFDDAVALLELTRELAPAEPHSHTDLAFALLLRLRREADPGGVDVVQREVTRIVELLLHVITSPEWARRFEEIEWPVLILLSWAVAWAEHEHPVLAADGGLWPESRLPAAEYRLGGHDGPQLDIFVWLGWDTDRTDVDLHVKEPTGEEVYYSHNRSLSTGATVSKDFTQGYGPEVYTLPRAPKGSYTIEANYFASHRASVSTGSTSAIIWSVQNLGNFEKEAFQFRSVRLVSHKRRQGVLDIHMH